MDDRSYRPLNYQIKYQKDLHIVMKDSVTKSVMVEHFSNNGYENLYINDNNRIVAVVTFDDFLKSTIVEGLNREFVVTSNVLESGLDIERYFIENPNLDRISVINDGVLICEIDALVELPLQNGLAKNIMALRYVDIFNDDLNSYFSNFSRVMILGNENIALFLSERFPQCVFNFNESDIEEIQNTNFTEFDIVIDFKYCSNIRRSIGFAPANLVSLSQVIMKYAVRTLISYCEDNGVLIKFYRLPKYENLRCLNADELLNAQNRIKAGQLIKDGIYLQKYETSDEELCYIKNRAYHASLRLDDGYCFTQDECDFPQLKVHNGIRGSESTISETEKVPHICLFGPCTAYGFLTPDEMTISSIINKLAEENKKRIVVENRAGIHGYNELNSVMTALATPVRKGDIIIFFDTLEDLDDSEYLNAQYSDDWFNEEKNPSDVWFFDFPVHCNYKANSVIAKRIYNDICQYIDGSQICLERTKYIDSKKICEDYIELTHSAYIKFYNRYKNDFIDRNRYKRIGALVVQNIDSEVERLINMALNYCDALYLFGFNTGAIYSHYVFRTQSSIRDKEIRIMQLNYFYNSDRYLRLPDSIDRYQYTERVFMKSILLNLGVNIWFTQGDTSMYCNQYIKSLCDENGLICINI